MTTSPSDPSHVTVSDIVEAKTRARAAALRHRKALTPEVRIEHSLALVDHVDRLGLERGTIVAGFWPIRDEIDPRPLMDALRVRGCTLALPAMVGDDLAFRRLTRESELVKARFGTVEPAPSADELVPDGLLVPLAAFDQRGARIGYGRGFYDRAIAALVEMRGSPPRTVGLAFSVQQVDQVPEEAHDRRLDAILTEAGLVSLTS